MSQQRTMDMSPEREATELKEMSKALNKERQQRYILERKSDVQQAHKTRSFKCYLPICSQNLNTDFIKPGKI